MKVSENEANSHDQINMTEFRLEYDRKLFTTTNVNIGTRPKNSRPTLTIEHDRKIYIYFLWVRHQGPEMTRQKTPKPIVAFSFFKV